MPEAAIDEDCRAIFAEYYIGSTGKFLYIKAVPESVGKEEAAHKKLRFGILAADALHAFVALLRIQFVRHEIKVVNIICHPNYKWQQIQLYQAS